MTGETLKADDLCDLGFSSYAPFNRAHKGLILENLPNLPGVYAIAASLHPRRRGSSDLIYFGCARNQDGLQRRIRQYYHLSSSQTTSQRINALVTAADPLGLSYAVAPNPDSVGEWENALLNAFRIGHDELPRENRKLQPLALEDVHARLIEMKIFPQPDWSTDYQRARCSVCGKEGRILLAGGNDPFFRGPYVAQCDCGEPVCGEPDCDKEHQAC